MNTFFFVSILVILFIISILIVDNNDDSLGSYLKSVGLFFTAILLVIFSLILGNNIGNDEGFQRGQEQALKGNIEYKADITYKLIDSVYKPIDTTYVSTKK